MATRKGMCTNYDGCSKAEKDEIFEIDEIDDFVCPECGHELEEIKSSKKKSHDPKLLMIIGGVLAIGVIVAILVLFTGRNGKMIEEIPVAQSLSDSVTALPEVEPTRNDTLVIKIESQGNVIENEDTTSSVEPLVEEIVEEVSENPVVEKTPVAKPVQPTYHKLSYGTWTGAWKNGKPHGTGTLTYSTSHTIDPRDPKGRVAQSGEYIVGEWDNGNLVQGRWFKKDGSKEAIIIGKAG